MWIYRHFLSYHLRIYLIFGDLHSHLHIWPSLKKSNLTRIPRATYIQVTYSERQLRQILWDYKQSDKPGSMFSLEIYYKVSFSISYTSWHIKVWLKALAFDNCLHINECSSLNQINLLKSFSFKKISRYFSMCQSIQIGLMLFEYFSLFSAKKFHDKIKN